MNAQTIKGTTLYTNKRLRVSDPFRSLAVKWVARQFNCSESYVYRIESEPNLNGGVADEIRKAYRAKYAELKQAVA
jgi:hypothetical protein